MSKWITINEINCYLLRIKAAISSGNYRFENRRKNIESLAIVGLLPKHAKEIILSLTYLNYFNGPEEERDPNYPVGEYMFFGYKIDTYDFYIKLKLERNCDNQDFCICISFHVAENPIQYPYS